MSTRITNPLQDAAHDNVDTEGQRRPGTNAVHKSSRARPHKHQYGWANLPAELIQKIVTLVNDATELDPVLRRGIHPAKMPVALAFKRQQWVCQARLVSSGWCNAVNSHSFWAEYAALLRPGYENEPTRGSTTLFHQAHRITVPVCIPCALSPYPSRGYPADPRRITPVRRLGRVPTCRDHYQKFCANCMNDASVAMRDPTVRDGANLNLRQMDSGDRDEQGVYRPIGSVACVSCRDAAIITALRSELAECARGWTFSGTGLAWDSALPIKDYMFYGEGKSDVQAKRAVEDMFLARHTRWLDYERDMLVIQRTLLGLKCHYFVNRIPVPQRVEVDTINTLWARIFDGEQDSLEFDLARFYRAWTNEIERGDYTEHEYRGDLERYLSQTVTFLWPILRDMLINASIDSWIRDRVYYGYWITPSDELDQIVAPGSNVHTPFHLLAQHAHNPHNGPGGPHLMVLMRREGLFKPPRSLDDPTWFLPPQRILQMMDSKFASELTRQIESPLTEIVEWHKDNEYGDADAAERTCMSWGVPQILNTLRMPNAWIEGSLVLKREPKGGDAATRNWSGPASDAGGGSVVSDAPDSPRIEVVKTDAAPEPDYIVKDGWGSSVHQDEDGEEEDGWIDEDDHGSDDMEDEDEWEDEFPVDKVDPSIDGRAVQPDCGERDRTLSVTARVHHDDDDDDAHLAGEAMLGKRKTSDDERTDEDEREERPTRPRLGSGQTSHSSEGDGASTALITPDDSPGLLAGSIQLAAEHDDDETATMSVSDSTPVAVVNVHGVRARSPSSSPNLGKRKSPDGDLHSERPVRRRGSHSTLTPSSTESVLSMSDGSDATEVKRIDEPMDTTVVESSVTAEAPAIVAIAVETTTVETAIQAVRVDSPPADTSLPPPGVLATDALHALPRPQPQPMDGVTGTVTERKDTPITEDTPISSNEEGNLNDEPVVDSVSDTPVGRSPSVMSYDDSSEYDSELDMQSDVTPFVPAPNTKLGPGATKLIETAWWQAREPLRECRCTICERARVVETNMALFAFGLESQGIRIA